jgi:hypothetical protein
MPVVELPTPTIEENPANASESSSSKEWRMFGRFLNHTAFADNTPAGLDQLWLNATPPSTSCGSYSLAIADGRIFYTGGGYLMASN